MRSIRRGLQDGNSIAYGCGFHQPHAKLFCTIPSRNVRLEMLFHGRKVAGIAEQFVEKPDVLDERLDFLARRRDRRSLRRQQPFAGVERLDCRCTRGGAAIARSASGHCSGARHDEASVRRVARHFVSACLARGFDAGVPVHGRRAPTAGTLRCGPSDVRAAPAGPCQQRSRILVDG